MPVAVMDGQYAHMTLELVFDATAAEQLHAALENHLAGRGARATHKRSRADLL